MEYRFSPPVWTISHSVLSTLKLRREEGHSPQYRTRNLSITKCNVFDPIQPQHMMMMMMMMMMMTTTVVVVVVTTTKLKTTILYTEHAPRWQQSHVAPAMYNRYNQTAL